MKYSRLETVQVLRDEEAETICVCQEGFTGDPDSKGEPFLFGLTAWNKKYKEDNVIFDFVGTVSISCSPLKGQRHEIFDFRFSTWISFPKAPDYTVSSNFFRKFAEIFAAQGAPPVSTTPVINGKNLQSEMFSLFLVDTFG
jgi:hypothetical protein